METLYCPLVRVTGLLIEDDGVLLVEEIAPNGGHWTIPGGCLEMGETLEEALKREMMEETGLTVEVGELLYVTDRFRKRGNHLVDLCFTVTRTGGSFDDRQLDDGAGEILGEIAFVPIAELESHGMDPKFVELIRDGFPHKGTYQGDFHELYG